MSLRLPLSLVISVFLAFVGLLGCCGTSEEGEAERLASHEQKVRDYSGKWPGFKPILDRAMEKTRAAFEEARGEGDEKKRVKRMVAANEIVGELIERLDTYGIRRNTLERHVNMSKDLRRDKRFEGAWDDAEEELDECEELMERARPHSREQLLATVNEAIEELDDELDDLERAWDKAKKRRDAKKKALKKKGTGK